MNNKELEKLLETLRQELKNTQGVDERGAELLRGLDEDLHHLLAGKESSPASMLDRWNDSLDHFKITHPALTRLLSDLMTSLSNAGI
ncbi:MAG: hypothetical protein HFACDABA_00178 [Anaerolineales bacterium]|nr:hypothetical protein [Anaerolineales bacterium]